MLSSARVELTTRTRVGTVGVLIPHTCWSEDNGWRNVKGESAVEMWQCEKAAFLEGWVLQKHGVITRD